MFLKKRKFFKRDNRDFLYKNYQYSFNRLDIECQNFRHALKNLEAYIEKASNKKYIYEYLLTVRDSSEVSIGEEICLNFARLKNDRSKFTLEDFIDFPVKLCKLAVAVDTIYSATDFVCYLNNNNLAIRRA
jgi:hypothetical protein